MNRKGATRRSAIPAEVLAGLNDGTVETATLAEGLAIDFRQLLRRAVPELPEDAVTSVLPTDGITTRMLAVGRILHDHLGAGAFDRLAAHASDTVRGWAAYLLAATVLELEERLERVRCLADDRHFGVREWAWLALRPHVAADLHRAVKLLRPWTRHASERVRRFAVEVTRPRGVWCSHLPELKDTPEIGLPLLTPLRADPARYVQDSVANWLNDAGKSNPAWVRRLCQSWLDGSESEHTARICKRALRGVKDE